MSRHSKFQVAPGLTQHNEPDQPLSRDDGTHPSASDYTGPHDQPAIASWPNPSEREMTVRRLLLRTAGVIIVSLLGIGLLANYDAEVKNLRPGAVLFNQDVRQAQWDYTIKLPRSDVNTSTILIWDFAAEDGDQVQILSDGRPILGTITIRNQPQAVPVPANGTVEVRGVLDGGGGGVTYAVNFVETSRTIINSADPGTSNKYTLSRDK